MDQPFQLSPPHPLFMSKKGCCRRPQLPWSKKHWLPPHENQGYNIWMSMHGQRADTSSGEGRGNSPWKREALGNSQHRRCWHRGPSASLYGQRETQRPTLRAGEGNRNSEERPRSKGNRGNASLPGLAWTCTATPTTKWLTATLQELAKKVYTPSFLRTCQKLCKMKSVL